MTATMAQCAYCQHHKCDTSLGPVPEDGRCMLEPLAGDARTEVVGFYNEGLGAQVMQATDTVMAQSGKNRWNHLTEIIEFARAMGFERIGIATCTMFLAEAKVLAQALKDAGFKVTSIACKTGEVHRNEVGLDADGSNGCVCNPYRQAQVLAEADTQMNISVGLCIGHDMLFNKLSQALTTTYFSKDYATDHNAIADLR